MRSEDLEICIFPHIIGTTKSFGWVKFNFMHKVKRWQIESYQTHFQVCDSLSIYLFYSQKSQQTLVAQNSAYKKSLGYFHVEDNLPSYLILLTQNKCNDVKKNNWQSVFLLKEFGMKSKLNSFVLRLKVNKNNLTLNVMKQQGIPSNNVGLLKLQYKWKFPLFILAAPWHPEQPVWKVENLALSLPTVNLSHYLHFQLTNVAFWQRSQKT